MKIYHIFIIFSERVEILELKNEFYKPRNLARSNELDRIVAAILRQNAMAMDSGYVDDVTRYRFQYSSENHVGTDVLALDILRGRDHGLQRYTEYLQLCSGRTVQSWDDLHDFIDDNVCSVWSMRDKHIILTIFSSSLEFESSENGLWFSG